MIIPQMKFEVVGACQLECAYCAHETMLDAYGGYQLSLAELEAFIDVTKGSGYTIDSLAIHGMGEPLVWKYFNEGVQRLAASGIVGRIVVTTNGMALHRVQPATWDGITEMIVSIYPNFTKHELLDETAARYGAKVVRRPSSSFRSQPHRMHSGKTPCVCICDGPMFVKDKIFLYCGPPVFDAAKLAAVDVAMRTDLWVPLTPFYMDAAVPGRKGNLDLCNGCWANDSLKQPDFPWGYTPSRVELAAKTAYANGVHALKLVAKHALNQPR